MGVVFGKLAAVDPDGAVFPHFPAEAMSLFRQAAALGALEDVTMTGSAATVTLELLALPEAEGLHFTGPDREMAASQTRRRVGPVRINGPLISNPLSSPNPRTFRCLARKDS